MTRRTDREHRRLELRAAVFARIANRALSRSTSGLDGLAKRVIARRTGTPPDDPELDHRSVEGS